MENKKKGDLQMKRRNYMNHGTNVQMYATESSSPNNTNNCASGCGSCSSGTTPPVGGGGATAIGGVIALGQVIIETSGNPDD